jgi:hypothetical protein
MRMDKSEENWALVVKPMWHKHTARSAGNRER